MRWIIVLAAFAIFAAIVVLVFAVQAVSRCLAILRACIKARNEAETACSSSKLLWQAMRNPEAFAPADALAEPRPGERHFGSPGRASGWGRE